MKKDNFHFMQILANAIKHFLKMTDLLTLILLFTLVQQSGYAQITKKHKNIVQMICYLDGEIIYNPDTSITIQALSAIDEKTIGFSKSFNSKEAGKLFPKTHGRGVFLMYSRDDLSSLRKNRRVLYQYGFNYAKDKLKLYFGDYANSKIIDGNHPDSNDILPQLSGGDQGLNQFIASHLVYPELAAQNQIMGTIQLGLIVNEDGTIADMKVIGGNDLGGGLVEEALSVGKKIPRLLSGSRNHMPMKAFLMVPIHFRLDSKKTVEE